MFFLGLLSTPLPYLLLAAFYFFGFAFGMFNNSSDEEIVEPISALAIQTETKEKVVDLTTTYYFQIRDQHNIQYELQALKVDQTGLPHPPDNKIEFYPLAKVQIYDFNLSGTLFSRPPPAGC